MIDFHTHIIPNVDDGSSSVEETFALIKEAKEAGFTGIISTSHYIEGYYESNVAERELWLNALIQNLPKVNFNGKLYLGNEIYFTSNIIELLEQQKVTTINNTNYTLFELPLNSKPLNLIDVIYTMQQYKLIPVLAHPERYSFVQSNPKIIDELIDIGVLMQQNYGSIIGQYGKKAQIIAKKMLEKNYITFFWSDVHKPNKIYKKMPEIIQELQNIIGREKFMQISTINPELALKNKKIEY